MEKKKQKFYITTSIAYTNANPHLGFSLETIHADVLARYHRQLGDDVLFSTGTDEHGIKIANAAYKQNQSPKIFTDRLANKFQDLGKILNLSNNDFIRTTDKKRHWQSVKKVWFKLKKNKDIYKKKYKGLYCVGCETFITEKDLVKGKCPIHQKEPEVIEEENYFFRLSKYSKEIEKIIKSDKLRIIPKSRKNEILGFIKQGLKDVSFSRLRKNLKWGIPVPDDKSQTIYVWGDALVNYLSVLDYAQNSKKFKKFWPADVQCIGKDILKFHCAIWPGMLLSLGIDIPKNMFVHGFITSNGKKMSKSLGNVIDPFELVEKYGTDAVRYFLLREISPTQDGDFTEKKFNQRYEADLAKGLGNLTARIITLAQTFFAQSLISNKTHSSKVQTKIDKTQNNYKAFLDDFKFNKALEDIWKLISFCDQYIEKKQPWKKSNTQCSVIYDLLFALANIAQMLQPFLPETSEKIFKQLGIKFLRKTNPKFRIKKSELLFISHVAY